MNGKVLLFLLLMLILPSSMSSTILRRRIARVIRLHEKIRLKSGGTHSFTAEEVGQNLIIRFEYSLENAEITVKDQYGNVVYQEGEVPIYEGKTVVLSSSDSYPYYVEVNSSVGTITGEIVVDESE